MPWSNAAAQNYVLLLQNGIQTSVPGVQSETQEDLLVYDGETYRDEIFATEMGTGRTMIITQAGGGVAVTNGLQVETPGIISGALSFTTPSDPHLEESDSFTHTPPHPLEKTRTRFVWWSGASGTGNVVAWAWQEQVVTFSPSDFIRI
jgi:hypothetical protein